MTHAKKLNLKSFIKPPATAAGYAAGFPGDGGRMISPSLVSAKVREAEPVGSTAEPTLCAALIPGLSSLLTVSDVAQLFAVSEKTIRRWIAAGRLPAVRLGRLVRISPKSLSEYIKLSGENDNE